MNVGAPAGPWRWSGASGRLVIPAVIAAAVIVLDCGTKAAVAGWLGRGEARHRRELIDPILAIEYVENTGAAFGLLRGQSAILVPVALVVVGGLLGYYWRAARPSAALAASLGLLVGGAVGNLIDRIRLGYVVDFVAVGIWPKFNVADAAVTLGVSLLAVHLLFEDRSASGDDGRYDRR